MRSLLVAISMLTRVPVPSSLAPTEEELARAAGLFPLVGAGVGLVAALALWLTRAAHLWALAPWAALAVAVALTGGFHEDGLADTADGLFGGADRQRRLEIMRDSRLGSYGVLALLLVLGAEVAALASLPTGRAVCALVAAHALSRAAVLPLTVLPYARAGQGLGRPLAKRVPARALAQGLLLGGGALALLPLADAFAVVALATAVVAYCGHRFLRDLGGITGDTLGAVVKLVELGTLVVVAAGVR